MLKNHITITFRNLLKNKLFSFINILGLGVGIATSVILYQYVIYESSYDKFYNNAERIFRVSHDRYVDGELQHETAQSFIPTGESMKNEYPEVLDYATLSKISAQSDIIVKYQNEADEVMQFSEEHVFHVKGNFLNIFSLPIILGQHNFDSIPPGTVLISQSMASKYFGEESPINKLISHNYIDNHKIIGVFEDIPKDSHFHADFLFSWISMTGDRQGGDVNNWHWDGFYTYLLLSKNADPKSLESKFPQFVDKYMAGRRNQMVDSKFHLQPLTEIHLYSNLWGEIEANGDVEVIKMLMILALFILLIAWVNYINLSTTRSLSRTKEIGVRKIVGSSRVELIKQFMIESMVVNLMSIILALTIIQLAAPLFAQFSGLDVELFSLMNIRFWIVFAVIFSVGSLFIGIYPALVVSSSQPIDMLKGKLTKLEHGGLIKFRKVLVVFQFIISLVLITGSIMIYRQISFMQNQQMGIDIDQTMVVKTHAQFGRVGADSLFVDKIDVLKNELAKYSNIKAATSSYDLPGKEHLTNAPHFRHVKNKNELVSLYFSRIDPDFIPALDVTIVAGRNFSKNITNDNRAIILNMEALSTLGFENPDEAIGHVVESGARDTIRSTVIGVVDFRSTSFKEKNYPVVYQTYWGPVKFLSIKLDNKNLDQLSESISLIQENWARHFSDKPFEYFFLDDLFDSQYQQEQKLSKLLTVFTGLAILIACLGLYGFSSFTIVKRTKELGIRKILGASVHSILKLLSKDFIVLALVAGVFTFPISWYVLKMWMENYAYKTEMPWWIYVLPVLILAIIVLITICYQVVKAVLINPLDSLKYE